jgi:nicotinamidase-related amidase
VFDIPVISTAQVNFGPIDESITAQHHAGVKVFEKKTFSMLDSNIKPYLMGLSGRKNAVLYGVEAHVCVRQTALDLLELNYDVHLVVDAVSSMNHHDRNIAIEGLRDAGVQIISF